MEELVLHYKLVKGSKEYYIFSTSAKSAKKTLNYNEAVDLISQYDAKDRNCKISSGLISLKRGMGRLPVKTDAKKSRRDTIYLYTKKEYLKSIHPCIYSNNEAFIKVKQDKGFLLRQRDAIYKIDKAKIVNLSLLKVETSFGIASIDELSTGCKTLLNILFMVEQSQKGIVNIDECGDNVLDAVFDAAAGTGISLYISHATDKIDTSRKFILNGEELKDDMDFLDVIWAEDKE